MCTSILSVNSLNLALNVVLLQISSPLSSVIFSFTIKTVLSFSRITTILTIDVQLHFKPYLSTCVKMTLFFKMWNVGFYTSRLNFNVIYLIMLMKFSCFSDWRGGWARHCRFSCSSCQHGEWRLDFHCSVWPRWDCYCAGRWHCSKGHFQVGWCFSFDVWYMHYISNTPKSWHTHLKE